MPVKYSSPQRVSKPFKLITLNKLEFGLWLVPNWSRQILVSPQKNSTQTNHINWLSHWNLKDTFISYQIPERHKYIMKERHENSFGAGEMACHGNLETWIHPQNRCTGGIKGQLYKVLLCSPQACCAMCSCIHTHTK